jgi:endonuclease YncB( thermonuclease family)
MDAIWMVGNRYMKRLGWLCPAALLILILLNNALGAPDESYGIVTKVIDGSTFEAKIEKADSRIYHDTERIILGDVESPDLNSSDGLQARDLAAAVLLNRRVFLDINNLGNGHDPQGRLVCVVYLSGFYGQPLLSPCFNRIMVDSGLAVVNDSKDNEFNLSDWWSRTSRSRPGYNDSAEAAIKRLEILARELLVPVQRELGKEYERRSKEAGDWLRQQLPVK